MEESLKEYLVFVGILFRLFDFMFVFRWVVERLWGVGVRSFIDDVLIFFFIVGLGLGFGEVGAV